MTITNYSRKPYESNTPYPKQYNLFLPVSASSSIHARKRVAAARLTRHTLLRRVAFLICAEMPKCAFCLIL